MILDINVNSVSVIIKKKETAGFSYSCSGRRDDGFVFVTGGNGFFKNDHMSIKLNKNTVLILQRGDIYTISAADDDFEYITTAFSVQPEGGLREIGLSECIEISDHSYILFQAKKMLEVWEARSSLYILKARIIVEQILTDLYEISQKRKCLYFSDKNRLLPAINHINCYYDKHIQVEQLATLCNMSISHFRRCFMIQFGLSPLQYRESIRIYWARQMLSSRMFSVSEVAERLGFCDIYHFSKVFKKQAGVSPSDFQLSAEENKNSMFKWRNKND